MRDISKDTTLFNGETFARTVLFRKNDKGRLPKSFKDIFGDLSDYIFYGSLSLSRLNLNSLEGCPKEIVEGFFGISHNPDLHDLNHFPRRVAKNFDLYLDYYLAQHLSRIDISSYKDAKISFSGFIKSQKNAGTEPVQEVYKNIVENFIDFREVNGDFERIQFPGFDHLFNYEEFEKLYNIFKKVGFDREKFDRALELTQF